MQSITEVQIKGLILNHGKESTWHRTLLVSSEEKPIIGDWVCEIVKGSLGIFRLRSQMPEKQLQKIIASVPQLEGTFNMRKMSNQEVMYSYISPDKIRITYNDEISL